MRVRFAKMHGLGNDFVLLDATARPPPTAAQARHLADRRRGVGCDQVLVVVAPAAAGCDVGMRVRNADGSEAEQCGNGLRCFALFARRRGLVEGPAMRVDTLAGAVAAEIEDASTVRTEMGVPRLEPDAIPFAAEGRAASYALEAAGETLEVGAASMGNPHAVLLVDDVDAAPVARLGPAVQSSGRFPRGVNVGFMQVVDRGRIRLRVFERGAGETPACGSGACAAVVVGRVRELLDEAVSVELPGGRLEVRWPGEGAPVWMRGEAVDSFEGEIEL